MKTRVEILLVLSILVLSVCALSVSNSEKSAVLSRQKRKFPLFPQFTTLQLSMCLIAQVSAITSHRLAVNHGFQINYGLPFQISSYYSPIFWARSLSNTSNLLVDFFERLAQSDDVAGRVDVLDSNGDEVETTTIIDEETTEHEREKRMVETDMSAGQFYSSIIQTMEYAGYHEDCLLKSVCELAKIPINHDDDDVIAEIMHFILTPSIHQAFDAAHEADDKELYEEAENIGRNGGDCELYSECKVSPLYAISNFISIKSAH